MYCGNFPHSWVLLGIHTIFEKIPSAFPSPYLRCCCVQIKIIPITHFRLGEQFHWGLWNIWSSKTSRIMWDLKLNAHARYQLSSASLSQSVPHLSPNLHFWTVPKVQCNSLFWEQSLRLWYEEPWRLTELSHMVGTGHEVADPNDSCSFLSILYAMKAFSLIKSLHLLPMTNHHCQKYFQYFIT